MKFAVVSVTAFPSADGKLRGLVYNLSEPFLTLCTTTAMIASTPLLGVSSARRNAPDCTNYNRVRNVPGFIYCSNVNRAGILALDARNQLYGAPLKIHIATAAMNIQKRNPASSYHKKEDYQINFWYIIQAVMYDKHGEKTLGFLLPTDVPTCMFMHPKLHFNFLICMQIENAPKFLATTQYESKTLHVPYIKTNSAPAESYTSLSLNLPFYKPSFLSNNVPSSYLSTFIFID